MIINIDRAKPGQEKAIVDLFRESFSNSEVDSEGVIVSKLAERLLASPPGERVFAFTAWSEERVLGAIFLSPLQFKEEKPDVMLLSPVAVAPDFQKQGIGRSLIACGMNFVRNGAHLMVTYGDPEYYGKLGFAALNTDVIPPPYPLTYPHGWLGKRLLIKEPLFFGGGVPQVATALRNPRIW